MRVATRVRSSTATGTCVTYPDVAKGGWDPLDHYLLHGAREGRGSCPSFHSTCYLRLHPDVQVSAMNPLLHYQQHGRREGRQLCDLWHGSSLDLTPAERYGELLGAALAPGTGSDVLWLGVIDWDYRIQRPQHLAAALASEGRRVIYVQPHFDPVDGRGGFTIVSNPRERVYEIRLKVGPPVPSLYAGLDPQQERQAIAGIRECAAELALRHPIAVLDFPAWRAVGLAIPEATVVMDCLDHVAGFSNVTPAVVAEETQLLRQADLVVASSQRLAETLGRTRSVTLIRNGADTAFFGATGETSRLTKTGPVIGYFGAIAEWFEVGWVEQAALQRPEWDFVLIGRVDGCDVDALSQLANVRLLGELPYAELPSYLHQFDAAIIPFKVTELIENTNPVKLYEYLSAGVPVIASPMPELVAVGDLAYLADGPSSFVAQVERALREDDETRRAVRRAWASGHDWRARGHAFLEAIDGAYPRVSVVVLCYNNWADTEACLESVLTLSQYPDERLEIIVVDNASTDETPEGLEALRQAHTREGRSATTPTWGSRRATTWGYALPPGTSSSCSTTTRYVTRGWIRRLIRPLMADGRVGLSGPLTNNIGNEQKVAIRYTTMDEMQRLALAADRCPPGVQLTTDGLAFFCVAIRREVLTDVGLLDEEYGVGFFEDDDYCRRAARQGMAHGDRRRCLRSPQALRDASTPWAQRCGVSCSSGTRPSSRQVGAMASPPLPRSTGVRRVRRAWHGSRRKTGAAVARCVRTPRRGRRGHPPGGDQARPGHPPTAARIDADAAGRGHGPASRPARPGLRRSRDRGRHGPGPHGRSPDPRELRQPMLQRARRGSRGSQA